MESDTNRQEKQSGLSWSTPSNQHKAPIAQKGTAPVHTTPVPAASNTAKYIGMIVVGVIVGVLVAWGWSSMRPSGTPITASSTTTGSATAGTNLGVSTTSIPALGADPSLLIMSPQSSGRSVAIAKAIVSVPTWVVIYENKEGKPGNALGAALFFPERQTGSVELLRATTAGKSYLAVKQVDNGDRKFSLKGDPFLSEGGNVMWVTFEVK